MLLQMSFQTRRNASTDSFGLMILLQTMLFDELWLRMSSRIRRHDSNDICCWYVLFRFTNSNRSITMLLYESSCYECLLGHYALVLYCFYCWYIFIYMSTFYVFILLLLYSSPSYGPNGLVRCWKIVN